MCLFAGCLSACATQEQLDGLRIMARTSNNKEKERKDVALLCPSDDSFEKKYLFHHYKLLSCDSDYIKTSIMFAWL